MSRPFSDRSRRPFRRPAARSPRRLLPALGLLLALTATTSAHAATTLSGTDPKGDLKGDAAQPAQDILKVETAYDEATGAITVSIVTAAPFDSAQGLTSAFVGTTTNGACDYEEPGGESKPFVQFVFANLPDAPNKAFWAYAAKNLDGDAAVKKDGTTLEISTPANPELVGLPLDCVFLATASPQQGPNGAIVDTAQGLVSTAAPKTPTATTGAGRTPAPVTTSEADGDRDGVADRLDACVKVPGAKANGCPTVAAGREFRLGQKRVVVDVLGRRTAAKCPPRARITVTSKGRSIGTGVVVVGQHGAFCRVAGVVRLRAKKAKVRVKVKGTGMVGIAKSIKR